MKKTVFKLFMAWESDKEEKWLNDMSAKGMQLVKSQWLFYTFEEGEPGEYVYRLELLEHSPCSAKSAEYIHFLEDTGVECIGSCMRWVYLRKKASEGPFDLYSDINSRIKQLDRILTLIIVATSMMIFSIAIMCLGHGAYPSDFSMGFVIGVSPFLVVLLYGMARILGKRRSLDKERKLRE